MAIEEAKQIVAEKDGYDNFKSISEEHILEYTERAYNLLISKMYSETEVNELAEEAYNKGIGDGIDSKCSRHAYNKWFKENKK